MKRLQPIVARRGFAVGAAPLRIHSTLLMMFVLGGVVLGTAELAGVLAQIVGTP